MNNKMLYRRLWCWNPFIRQMTGRRPLNDAEMRELMSPDLTGPKPNLDALLKEEFPGE